jgi:hypothetical protein
MKKDTNDSGLKFDTDWYELWMKQTKDFFETADKNLKDMFTKGSPADPSNHLKQIDEWLEALKAQWEKTPLTTDQKAYQDYWKMMSKMSSDAGDLMLAQWIKRTQDQNPVTSVRELYDLWLNSCHQVYQKSLQSKAYQDVYGEFMNAALKFWKSAIPK